MISALERQARTPASVEGKYYLIEMQTTMGIPLATRVQGRVQLELAGELLRMQWIGLSERYPLHVDVFGIHPEGFFAILKVDGKTDRSCRRVLQQALNQVRKALAESMQQLKEGGVPPPLREAFVCLIRHGSDIDQCRIACLLGKQSRV